MSAVPEKVVLVTGSSECCLARAFARQGYGVAIISRNTEKFRSDSPRKLVNLVSRVSPKELMK